MKLIFAVAMLMALSGCSSTGSLVSVSVGSGKPTPDGAAECRESSREVWSSERADHERRRCEDTP